MPWKESDKMSERMKFIGRLLEGEKMTDICAEFGISRVTGYNIWNRYEAEGLKALQERSRRPQRRRGSVAGFDLKNHGQSF